jgi:hypothetical protein
MNRLIAIQKIIDKIQAQIYVEIGVRDAAVINKVNAPFKYGIDPFFSLSGIDSLKKIFHLLNFKAMDITSDSFFAEKLPARIKKEGIDVIFVDGLHTYNQALTDVENSLKYLNENGFIIMHDCNPVSALSAFPIKESFSEIEDYIKKEKIEGWNWNWNGDVWKALVHLRIMHDDLQIFTINADWGLGIIKKGPSEKLNKLTVEELKIADYSLLENNRIELLNLREPSFFDDIINSL